jgi:hypothetical protein
MEETRAIKNNTGDGKRRDATNVVAVRANLRGFSQYRCWDREADRAYYSPTHTPSAEKFEETEKPQITAHGRPTTWEGKTAAAQFRPPSSSVHMISRDASTEIEWTRRSTAPRDHHTIAKY